MSVTTTGAFGFWHAGQPVLMWQPMGAFGHWHAGQPLVWPVALPPEPPPPPSLSSGRAWAMERLQVGVEATPGEAVTPALGLAGARLALQPAIEAFGLRRAGARFAGEVVVGQEWSRGELSGWPVYEELCYLFAALWGPAQVTVPAGAQVTRRWCWRVSGGVAAEPLTLTVGQGQDAGAVWAAGACLSGLSLVLTPERLELSGQLVARAMSDGLPLPAGNNLAGVPLQAGSVRVLCGATVESLAPRRALGTGLAVGGWRAPVFGPGFVGLMELRPEATLEVVSPAAESFLGARWLRVVAQGPWIEPGFRYRLQVTARALLARHWLVEESGLQAVGREFAVAEDPEGGAALEILIDCPLEAL